jgi:hypothetical protein
MEMESPNLCSGVLFYAAFVDDIHSKTNDDIPSATDDMPPTADCGAGGSITFFGFGNIMNTE